MAKYRNISGEGRSGALLHGKWVEPDEVITVPDHLSEPHIVWPDVTWEPVSVSKKES